MGHGHLNASIIMGQPKADMDSQRTGIQPGKDPGGYLLGQGVAPTRASSPPRFSATTGFRACLNRNSNSLVAPAYQAGARISSNSWVLTHLVNTRAIRRILIT